LSTFGKLCRPDNPVGPCMVSQEGACSAFYLYGGENDVRDSFIYGNEEIGTKEA